MNHFLCPPKKTEKKELIELYENKQNIYNLDDQQNSSKNIENQLRQNTTERPSTSPGDGPSKTVPERKIKSETTMEEIEKALRNYETRLKCLDSLEPKVRKLKKKLIENNIKEKEWEREKLKNRMTREVEKEKSNRQMSELCSENWTLKKQMITLKSKFAAQMKKMEGFKNKQQKLIENDVEKEELKKELMGYRQSLDEQRKCIKMLQNVVEDQKTEIQKLLGLINNLTSVSYH